MAHILVADDDDLLRSVIKDALEFSGYQIADAQSNSEIFEHLNQGIYELVIIDLMMSGQGGIESIVKIKRSFKGVKIIAMSASGEDSPILEIAQNIGADAVLDKPFYLDELTNKIEILLKK